MRCADLTTKTDSWTILLYGGYGVGKTTFLGTMPKPTLILDFDKGIRTRGLMGLEDVDYVPLHRATWSEIESFWNRFVNYETASFGDEEFNLEAYASWSVDSLTSVLNIMFPAIADKVHMKDRIVVDERKHVHMADYGVARGVLRDMTREAQNTRKDVVLTSHERIERDRRSGGIVGIGPELSPALIQGCGILLDEMWRLYTTMRDGETVRVIQTSEEGYYAGKSRLLGTQRVYEPTFDKLVSLAKESVS